MLLGKHVTHLVSTLAFVAFAAPALAVDNNAPVETGSAKMDKTMTQPLGKTGTASPNTTGAIDTQGTAAANANTGMNMAAAAEPAHILAKLHHMNQEEITASKLAMKNGTSKEVKDFAQMLIKDHQTADKQVMDFAKARNMQVAEYKPITQQEIQDAQEHKAAMQSLQNMKGQEFDQTWMKTMTEAHKDAVASVSEARTMVTDQKLKDLLAKIEPTLQKHYHRADKSETMPAATSGTTTQDN